MTRQDTRHRVPATLGVAVGLLAAQGVGLFGLSVALAVASLVGQPTDRTASLTEAVLGGGLGVLLALLAYWLLRGHRAARGPAVVLELMLLPVGYYMIKAGVVWAGVLAVVLGLAVCGLLVAPASRHSLGIE